MPAQTKPIITIMFDDDSETVYTQGFARMEPLGIKGSNAIITGAYGGGLLSNVQYQALYDAGWSLVSHTVHHYHVPTLSDEDIVSEISNAKASIDSRGWTRDSDLIVWPYNETNEHVLNLALPYIRGATWKTGGFAKGNDFPVDRYRIRRRGAGAYTVDEIKQWVDESIHLNQHLHLYFHAIGTPSDGYTYDPDGFQQIMEYIATKRDAGELVIMTMGEFVDFATSMEGRIKSMPRLKIRSFAGSLIFSDVTGQKVQNATSVTNSNTTCSISGWFKPTAAVSGQGIIQLGEGGTSRHAVSIGSRLIRAGFYNGSAYNAKSGAVLPRQWNHFVYTWGSSTPRLYLNGIEQTGTTAPISTTQTGVMAGATSNRFVGKLTNIKVWNTTLTAQQASDLYYSDITPTSGLWLSWLMGDGSGSTAADSSGNSHNGAITSGTFSSDVPMLSRGIV